jgi:hypothetical protein
MKEFQVLKSGMSYRQPLSRQVCWTNQSRYSDVLIITQGKIEQFSRHFGRGLLDMKRTQRRKFLSFDDDTRGLEWFQKWISNSIRLVSDSKALHQWRGGIMYQPCLHMASCSQHRMLRAEQARGVVAISCLASTGSKIAKSKLNEGRTI